MCLMVLALACSEASRLSFCDLVFEVAAAIDCML